MKAENKRIHIHYHGRVQGVGFRYTAQRLARGLGVYGWVKNLSDGQVELVGEGKQEQLNKLINSIDQEFSDYIRHKEINWMSSAGEFNSFEIRFF